MTGKTSRAINPKRGIVMNMKALSFSAFAVALSLAPFAAGAEDIPENLKGTGEVVITSGGGTWEDAQKKAFFEPFTRDTGIKVVLVPEDHAKLLASVKLGQPEADITSVPGGALAGFVSKNASRDGLLLFDKNTLANMPDAMKNKYGVGALLYSITVAFNTKKYPDGGKQPKNWVDFYNVKEIPGPRTLPKCEKLVDGGLLEGAIMGDGVPADKVYRSTWQGLRESRRDQALRSRWRISGAEAPQSLSRQVTSGRLKRPHLRRQAGGSAAVAVLGPVALHYDYWVVMKGSPNKENAENFSPISPRAAAGHLRRGHLLRSGEQ